MFSRDAGAVGAIGFGGAHHGFAGLTHHGAHVFKVDVDMARDIDDFSDTAYCVFQHVVGMGKGLVLRHIVAQHVEQFFIEHDDQGVHIGFQFRQACVGIGCAAAAFKLERLGDHTDGQNTHFLGDTCNHGRGTGAGAAAHAGGDEQHVCASNGVADVVHRQFSGVTAFVRFAACAQAGAAQLNGFVRSASAQGLGVGVGADELDALHAAVNHVTHGVAATTADADHLDERALVEFFNFHHFDAHGEPPVSSFVESTNR